jgi:hypothetical protein
VLLLIIAEAGEVVRAGTFEGNMFIHVPHLPPELKGQQDPEDFFKRMKEMDELR